MLFAVFVQGLPLSLELSRPDEQVAEEVHEATLRRVTTAGYENAVLPSALWGAAYLLAVAFVLKAPASQFVPRGQRWTTVAVLSVIAVSARWSAYPLKVATNLAHMAGVMAIALAAAHRYRRDVALAVEHIACAFGLCTVIHVAASVVLPAYSIDADGRWAGLAGNANTLGVIGWCTLWANAAAYRMRRAGKARRWHALFGAASAIAVVFSQSRTSMLCAVVSAGGFSALATLKSVRRLPLRYAMVAVLLIAPVMLIGLDALGFGWAEIAGLSGRSSDMSGRFPIWAQAIELIKERPLLGWGFDDNSTVIELTGLPHTTFHDGFLDVMVRGGLVALAIVLALTRRAVADVRAAARDGSPRLAMIAFSTFVGALFIENITEASFLAARNASWILLLFIGYSAALCRIDLRRDRLRAHPAGEAS